MSKMGERGLNRMDYFGNFGGFQEINSGRTLDVLFWHLPLALGGQYCVRRIKI